MSEERVPRRCRWFGHRWFSPVRWTGSDPIERRCHRCGAVEAETEL